MPSSSTSLPLRPARTSPVLILHPVARAAAVLAVVACALAPLAGAQAQSAAPAAAAAHRYQLAAGDLDAVLTQFASQAQITLSFDPQLVQGLHSQGLQGSHTPAQGLEALLRGTGLEAVQGGSGGWQVRRHGVAGAAGAAGGAVLDTVLVQDRAERTGITEGSGSYAPRDVTVGGKRPTAWKEVPASVSVVTRQQIEDQNLITVEDALRQVTGVTAISYGDGTAYFKSRGHDSDVQYDGLPANNGLQYLSQFDLAMYDRLEVLRGPGGVLQGAGGAAGTVNLVRKRPLADPAVTGTLSAGSWGRLRSEVDISRPLNESGSVRGRAVLAGQNYANFQDRGREKHGMAYGVVEADLTSATQLTLSLASQSSNARGIDYGAGVHPDGSFVKAPRSAFFGTDWSRSHNTTQELFAELNHRLGGDWQAKLSYLDRKVDGHSNYSYLMPGIGYDYTANYRLQAQDGNTHWRGVDANVGGSFELGGRRHEALLGFNQAWRDEDAFSGFVDAGRVNIFNIQVPERPVPFRFGTRSHSVQSGLYGQLRLKLAEPLTLALGGRMSWYESRSQNLLVANSPWNSDPSVNRKFTPQVGLTYAVAPHINLYGNYSEIFQPQTELGYGNVALKPRVGKQTEIGAKGVFLDGRLNATLAAFEIRDNNRAVGDPDHPSFSVARGKVRSRGWELEVSGRIQPGWDVIAGYTRLNNRYLSDPDNLGAVYSGEEPRNSFKLWTRYAFQNQTLRGWHVGAGMRAQSSTSRDAAAQGGYTVVDAQLGYQISRNVSATLSVNNLFDKTYYARVPSRFYSVWGDPRNAMLTLRASF